VIVVIEAQVGVVAGAEVVGSVEALDGLGLEGDAFMPGFEKAFPVVEVIEVQAGVAEWRRYRRG
jgi:hypothetical protein